MVDRPYLAALLLLAHSHAYANSLDNHSASVSMEVAVFASVSGLDEVVMTKQGGGTENVLFFGTDEFRLESNGPVNIQIIEPEMPESMKNKLEMDCGIDDRGIHFNTGENVHNQVHTIYFEAIVANMHRLKQGDYSLPVIIEITGL